MVEVKLIGKENFKQYGRILTGEYEVTELILALKKKEAPENSIVYVPSVEDFEQLPIAQIIVNSLFGGLPVQIGYCNGTNRKLNAVEYHRSSEIGVAATDLILLLGKQQDITEDLTYDSSKIEAFLVPEGTVFEMYATTLHYAPCSVDGKPFRNIVALPKGTNIELTEHMNHGKEDQLMTAKNKWLIAHSEAGIERVCVGVIGDNLTV